MPQRRPRTLRSCHLSGGLVMALMFVPLVGTSVAPVEADAVPPASVSLMCKATGMQLVLTTLNGESVTATLGDGPAARAFAALLPLTLTLEDYAATEKISTLPLRLPTDGEPAGFDPAPGDLTYYAPWGNLAIFHKDFGSSRGLVSLGRLGAVPEAFRRPGPLKVVIREANP